MTTPLQICPPAPGWRGWWLLLALLSTGLTAGGQTLPPSRAVLVKFAPQHAVVSGYWLEVEQQRRYQPRQSFTLTPQLYSGPAGHPDGGRGPNPLNQDESVRGAGVQAQHRLYLLRPPTAAYPAGLYLSYGPHLQHFQMTFHRNSWNEVEGPGGLPYYAYGPVPTPKKLPATAARCR